MEKRMIREPAGLGGKVRTLRRRQGLSQVQLAERLGISASYLNLIESNRRPLPANLLIKVAQHFEVDLDSFAADNDARMISDLLEAFADPLFEAYALSSAEVRDMVTQSPGVARAVLALYAAYKTAREASDSLASRVAAGEEAGASAAGGGAAAALPSEEVSDLIQKHMNHFPELESAADDLRRRARLEHEEAYPGLIRHLEKAHGIHVRIAHWGAERGIVRRYDPDKKILTLSELLPTRSRTFNLAHQLALLEHRSALDRLTSEPSMLTSDASRTLARVALANYFAGAVLMPYGAFLRAAREERFDIDVLGRRFRVGFEQVCHRLTTLRRSGAEGIPFHMIRIDVAGNISKRFSGSGIRFARFSGACPRWNIFAAFMTPGMIRIQVSRMPDGVAYFCVARTIHKDSGGYHSQQPVLAIGLGCQLSYAKEMVYSNGVDLDNHEIATPVGVTCRVCERTDCEQRAFPSMKQPLPVDENVRGVSLYAPASGLKVLP
jgi:predicted transcriptional regulator/transcriptional regulator with XRE-family HTH domain